MGELASDRALVMAVLTSADEVGQAAADGADLVEFDGGLDYPDYTGDGIVTIADGDEDETLTAASLAAWSGARVLRTRNVRQTRKVVEMVASIAGTRPPARAVRALA